MGVAVLYIRVPLVERETTEEEERVKRCLWCYQPLESRRRKRHADCQEKYLRVYTKGYYMRRRAKR